MGHHQWLNTMTSFSSTKCSLLSICILTDIYVSLRLVRSLHLHLTTEPSLRSRENQFVVNDMPVIGWIISEESQCDKEDYYKHPL